MSDSSKQVQVYRELKAKLDRRSLSSDEQRRLKEVLDEVEREF